MTQNEELIFGLKRWLSKAIKYCNNRPEDEFLKDDMAFDAASYCIEVISEIGQKISQIDELNFEYKNINFKIIGQFAKNCFMDDNINVSLIYQLLTKEFPRLLMELLMVKQNDNNLHIS